MHQWHRVVERTGAYGAGISTDGKTTRYQWLSWIFVSAPRLLRPLLFLSLRPLLPHGRTSFFLLPPSSSLPPSVSPSPRASAACAPRCRVGREVVDLRTLLLHCAQAVATDDRRGATELLKQIERHASAHGDAMQRLARCFAEGLQARLAGTGSSTSTPPLMPKQRTPVVDMLQAYQLYMAAICFKKAFYLFSNQTIHAASLGKKKIHIIDYGIHYGL